MAIKSSTPSRTGLYARGNRFVTYDIAKFQRQAKTLQESGIIPASRSIKNLDPNSIVGGKTMHELLDKFEGVVSGKATVFDATKVKEKGSRKLYERTTLTSKTGKKREVIIVPHSADQIAYLENGRVVRSHPAGIEMIEIPVEYHNLEQWLHDAKNQKYLKKGMQFGFRFFGGSSAVYANMQLLLDELMHYESVETAIRSGDKGLQREMFRNLEIVRVQSTKQWNAQRAKNKSAKKAPKKVSKKKSGKGRKNNGR